MENPIIELKSVTVELGEEVILKDVNLRVYPNETIVLIGPSGGGKTVLLKTMAGLFEPVQGEVFCYGHKWADLSLQGRHDLARHVGVQFQKGALFDDMNAFDNVAYPLREHTQLSEEEIKTRVMDCLKAVRLDKAADLEPHEMSGGMRLRLGVARAIALKPEILFMDDPTAGLDPVNSDEVAQVILDLKEQISATLIVVTHDMMRAYQFAGRIFLVAQTAVLETGSAEETEKHTDLRVQQFLHGWQKGPLTNNGGN
ncbi:MAG: ABC transporter ATP-binding protein [Bdellovibrionales bacterium]